MNKKFRNKSLHKSNPQNKIGEPILEKQIDRYFWLIIPLLTIVYYYISNISVGFYQDDEIAQYINMIDFWHDPFIILGNAPKPGYKIFMVLPALIGYDAVLLMNSLIASLAVFLSYKLLKAYEVQYAFLGAVLLALQPLFFDLSFRSYSEIFTALLVAILLLSYKRQHYFLAALTGGYIFTVRQEFALFLIVFIVILLRDKRYIALSGMIIFPLLYDLLGFMKTGDILFILSEMQKVAGLEYQSQGLFHYFKVYVYIIGPVSLLLFAYGFFGFIQDTSKVKEYLVKYLLFYVIFVSIFIAQVLTMINDGPNPGNWRYLLHLSPVCVFFATLGFNKLADDKFRNSGYILAVVTVFFTLLFSSKKTDGFKLLDQPDFTNLFIIIAAFILTLIMSRQSVRSYLDKLSISMIVLAVISLLILFEPRQLSQENAAMKSIAEKLDSYEKIDSKTVLANHSFLKFYSGAYKNNPSNFGSIESSRLNELNPGSIVVWESHYGYRPEWGLDVNLPELQDTTRFDLLDQLITPDKKFAAFIFQKK